MWRSLVKNKVIMESIASAVEVKGPDDDVFEHFEGGRLGVQKRFGEKIKSSLKGLNGLDAIRLAQDVGLEAEQVADISRGNFSKITQRSSKL